MPEKYILIGIAVCSLSIFFLLLLIFRTYVSRKSIFDFMDNKIFKPDMTFLGFISQAIFFIGFIFLILAFLFFFLLNYKWNIFLLIPIFASIVSIITAFVFLFKSYDWKVGYLKYRYIGLLIVSISFIAQAFKAEYNILITAQEIELSESLNSFFSFPFHIPLIVGYIILLSSIKSIKE